MRLCLSLHLSHKYVRFYLFCLCISVLNILSPPSMLQWNSTMSTASHLSPLFLHRRLSSPLLSLLFYSIQFISIHSYYVLQYPLLSSPLLFSPLLSFITTNLSKTPNGLGNIITSSLSSSTHSTSTNDSSWKKNRKIGMEREIEREVNRVREIERDDDRKNKKDRERQREWEKEWKQMIKHKSNGEEWDRETVEGVMWYDVTLTCLSFIFLWLWCAGLSYFLPSLLTNSNWWELKRIKEGVVSWKNKVIKWTYWQRQAKSSREMRIT